MMKKIVLCVISVLIIGCSQQTAATESSALVPLTPSMTQKPTQTLTLTATVAPSTTPSPTATPISTRYADETLNCPGSVALMYHSINPLPNKNRDFLQNNSDIGSFEKVVLYLVENDFYFPSPSELAEDFANGVCRHKYAIIVIDDSWNDPETMGVTKVLTGAGGGTGKGKPKVWFAVITYALGDFVDSNGNTTIHAWEHFRNMQNAGLVYIVSHSQTHPILINPYNPEDKVNKKIFKTIGDELLPSRKDILWGMEGTEPYFFVYPAGIVAAPILEKIRPAGYVGAFTVWEGSLDKSLPYSLPRINGGLRCGTLEIDNSFCVIELIEKYSKP